MTEVELKLLISPQDVAAFRRCAPLAGVSSRRRTLTSIYYDTPEFTLAGAGVGLRLRRANRRWTQTLKLGGDAVGGLHARGEWENARPGASIDVSGFEGAPPRTLRELAEAAPRLAPAFTVTFQRETWDVEPVPGTRLEVALDHGVAQAGERSDPVCEVEIELIEGDRGAAFDFAQALLEATPLRPSALTKAGRGYRLLLGKALVPAKAGRVALDPAMPIADAARAIASACLGQLQSNEEGVLTSTDPEFVHQARVGLRRLRSALRVFRDAAGEADSRRWRTGLGEIARALGEARDWDVFATETLPPLLRAFGDAALARSLRARVQARRAKAREAARACLQSAQYARLVLEISRWLSGTSPPASPDMPAEPLAAFAARLVDKRHKRLIADARRLASLPPEARHEIRIDAKRLRYAMEGFASLFRAKRVNRHLDTLAALQDTLGRSNDAITATRLIAAMAPPEAFALFARGWVAARVEGDAQEQAVLVDKLAAAKRFWRQGEV